MGTRYAVNAASGTVSSYTIAKDGSLALKAAVAANTGAGGTDAALSADQHFLYVRMGGGRRVLVGRGPRRLADRARDDTGCARLRDRRARGQLTSPSRQREMTAACIASTR